MEKFEKLVRLIRVIDYYYYEDGWASEFKDVIKRGLDKGVITVDEAKVLYKLYWINAREKWEEEFDAKEKNEDEENW